MKKKIYGSLLLNIFTMISVIVCAIILTLRGPKTFRMFTTQSNIIAGIVATIFLLGLAIEIVIQFFKVDKQ